MGRWGRKERRGRDRTREEASERERDGGAPCSVHEQNANPTGRRAPGPARLASGGLVAELEPVESVYVGFERKARSASVRARATPRQEKPRGRFLSGLSPYCFCLLHD